MKLDTSSYYPKSPLDDDNEESAGQLAANKPVVPADLHLTDIVTADEAEYDQVSAPVPVADASADDDPPVPDQSPLQPNLPPTEADCFITRVSHLLSWVLVPLLMPVYGIMLAFGLSILSFTSPGTRLVFTAVVAAFNILIPALVVLVLKHFGVVKDVGLNGQRERFIPYLVCIACLVGTAIFMAHKGAPMWLVMFFFGGAVTGLIEVVVNVWWKISAHAAGIAGIVALLVHLFMDEYIDPTTEVWLMVAIGLAGLLGSARIWLGRHTLGQVLAGYVVGFCSVFFLMLI